MHATSSVFASLPLIPLQQETTKYILFFLHFLVLQGLNNIFKGPILGPVVPPRTYTLRERDTVEQKYTGVNRNDDQPHVWLEGLYQRPEAKLGYQVLQGDDEQRGGDSERHLRCE